ncbi:MAG: hypothetical protein MJA29_08885 [Candidatus Omnitrophica bacterium]|nr:hypothetical protein [Candidatus Omnitrophota bacterium]
MNNLSDWDFSSSRNNTVPTWVVTKWDKLKSSYPIWDAENQGMQQEFYHEHRCMSYNTV